MLVPFEGRRDENELTGHHSLEISQEFFLESVKENEYIFKTRSLRFTINAGQTSQRMLLEKEIMSFNSCVKMKLFQIS